MSCIHEKLSLRDEIDFLQVCPDCGEIVTGFELEEYDPKKVTKQKLKAIIWNCFARNFINNWPAIFGERGRRRSLPKIH